LSYKLKFYKKKCDFGENHLLKCCSTLNLSHVTMTVV